MAQLSYRYSRPYLSVDSEVPEVTDPNYAKTWFDADGNMDVTRLNNYEDRSYICLGDVMPGDSLYLDDWPDIPMDALLTLTPMVAAPDEDLDVGHPVHGTYTIQRLKEGIERFYITDINSPTASIIGQSALPVMWHQIAQEAQWFNRVPGGCKVFYMDGHVSFLKYPSEESPLTKNYAVVAETAGRAGQ